MKSRHEARELNIAKYRKERIKNAFAMINIKRKDSKREARYAVCTQSITKRR